MATLDQDQIRTGCLYEICRLITLILLAMFLDSVIKLFNVFNIVASISYIFVLIVVSGLIIEKYFPNNILNEIDKQRKK